MRSFALGSMIFVIFMLFAPALAGEEQPGSLARNYYLTPKAGHAADLEAGFKKQVAWYETNGDEWAWQVWQWETGDAISDYIFRSPGHHWKDLDVRADFTSKARAHFMEVIGPHVESIKASIHEVLPDVSHWPDDYGEVPMVEVYSFQIHYGMAEQFHHVMNEIHDAIVASGWPVTYSWSAMVSGGEVGTYALVLPHKSWAEMKGPEKPFWSMMEETLGRQEADALKDSLRACVREQHGAIARFRPDLSSTPGKK
ncbi:MAG: hypothetical protein JSV80_11515 [Acidobacteriota bacterium]|nr:MAG: hypothetical protein JSV80_11515 [Acidobacteriota bacterium]